MAIRGKGNRRTRVACGLLVAASLVAGGCATQGPSIAAPQVRLESVRLDKAGLYGQTFVLGFSVHNPNAFALPVRNVRYEVRLDDARFAGGETRSGFVVAPRSGAEFAISVELDLLQSASGFDTLRDSSFGRTVRYELNGSLRLDLPSTKPVAFSESGSVHLGEAAQLTQ